MNYTTSTNPYTLQVIARYDIYSDQKIEHILAQAASCYLNYRKTSYDTRAAKLLKLAELLEVKKMSLAILMTKEMGKVLRSSLAEIEKCAWVCRYYAEHGEAYLADEPVSTEAKKSYISYQSLGIILAVMPWNYPFWQVFRFAVPCLMSGNVGILKHASNVSGCALAIEGLFAEAGFPAGAFSSLIADRDQVKKVIEDSRVKAVTLTGSGPAGASVASTAAANIKTSVLELGGNDAYLILEDADLELAVSQCTQSRLLNTGQSCIGAKRFIVVRKVYDVFLEKFTIAMSKAILGDPMQEVTMGPMARIDLRDELHQQVVESLDKGAKLHLGGYIPELPGAFYPATILTDVKVGMPAYEEELFGPVASVIAATNTKEAIRIANDTKYGLGACIFSKNEVEAERIAAEELHAGCCFVNHYVKSDPRLPFGGIKESGYGRELSYHGIRAFVNIKTVYIN